MNIDSLDLIGIIIEVEDTFDIQLNEKNVEKLKNFGDTVNYLETVFSTAGDTKKIHSFKTSEEEYYESIEKFPNLLAVEV